MTCKAAVAVEKGVVRLAEVPVEPPRVGELQMRVRRTLISPGTERAFILGMDNATNEFPFVPGYCCAGEVAALGEGVSGFAVGERIAAFALDIGHREIGNVPVHKVIQLPEAVALDHATFCALGQVSLQAVRKSAIEIGEPVAVMGLGIIGLLALQFARVAGALPLIAVDRDETRLARALQLGADHALRNAGEDFAEQLCALTGGKGPAVVLEGTGFPEAIAQACDMIGRMGRLALLGSTRGVSEINFYRDVHKKGVSIIGAHAECIPLAESYPRHWTFRDDAECFVRLLLAGKIQVDPMIDWRIGTGEIEEAYRRLLSGDRQVLGVVIDWDRA